MKKAGFCALIVALSLGLAAADVFGCRADGSKLGQSI